MYYGSGGGELVKYSQRRQLRFLTVRYTLYVYVVYTYFIISLYLCLFDESECIILYRIEKISSLLHTFLISHTFHVHSNIFKEKM